MLCHILHVMLHVTCSASSVRSDSQGVSCVTVSEVTGRGSVPPVSQSCWTSNWNNILGGRGNSGGPGNSKALLSTKLLCPILLTPILHTCLTLSWSCLRSTAGSLMILLWFWVMGVQKTKTIASSWFHRKFNFLERSNFNHFDDSRWCIKNGINHKN